MKSIRWSKLYPRTWQEQFGEEFDEMNSMRGVRAKDVLDIAFRRPSGRSRVCDPVLVCAR